MFTGKHIVNGEMLLNPDEFISENNPSKAELLSFFSSIPADAVAAGHLTDIFTGKEIKSVDLCYFENGQWWWTTRDIYHFNKYDMKLDGDFCDYVLKQVSQ